MRRKKLVAALLVLALCMAAVCWTFAAADDGSAASGPQTVGWKDPGVAGVTVTLEPDGTGFVYDNPETSAFPKVTSDGWTYARNRVTFSMNIAPSEKLIQGDFTVIVGLWAKSEADVWTNVDGVYLQIQPDKMLIYLPDGTPTSDASTAKMEIPFDLVDGQTHTFEAVLDPESDTFSLLVDGNYAQQNYKLQSDGLVNNHEGGFFFMGRGCTLTVSDFFADDTTFDRYTEVTRFYLQNGPAEYTDLDNAAGASFGSIDGQAAMHPAILGVDPPAQFRTDVMSFTLKAEEVSPDGGAYFFATLRSELAQDPTWGTADKIYLIQETGKAAQLVVSGEGGQSAELSGVDLLDGESHRVEITVDDEAGKVTAAVDGLIAGSVEDLAEGVIPEEGAILLWTQSCKVHVANFRSEVFKPDASAMTEQEVAFQSANDYATKVNGSDAGLPVTGGRADGHLMARLEGTAGQPFIRSVQTDYTADLYTFKIAKAAGGTGNPYLGIVLRGTNVNQGTVDLNSAEGLKIIFYQNATNELHCNSTAAGALDSVVFYHADIADGREHTVTVRIFDDRTENNVELTLDGRRAMLTVSDLPEAGGVLFTTDGTPGSVTEFRAYRASVAVSSVELAEQTGVIALDGETTIQLDPVVLPENATDKSVTYESDHPEIASVSDTGLITGLQEGTAVITVRSVSNPEATASFTVTVTSSRIEPEEVQVVDASGAPLTSVQVEVQKTWTIRVKALPEGAMVDSVTYASNDEAVFTVSDDGVITAVAKGSAELTVTVNGTVSKVIPVEVLGVQPSSIEIREDKQAGAVVNAITLGVDGTFAARAVVYPLNAENREYTLSVEDPTVASVENGVVTGLQVGETRLIATAEANGISCSIPISVLPAVERPADDPNLKDYMQGIIFWGTHANMTGNVSLGSELVLTSTSAGNTPLIFSKTGSGDNAVPSNDRTENIWEIAFQLNANASHNDFLGAFGFLMSGEGTLGNAGTAFYDVNVDVLYLVIFNNKMDLRLQVDGQLETLYTWTWETEDGVAIDSVPNMVNGLTHYLRVEVDQEANTISVRLDNLEPTVVEGSANHALPEAGGVQIMVHNSVMTVSEYRGYDTAVTLPTGISLAESTAEIEVGDTYVLTPSVSGSQPVADDLVYLSSDESKAIVTADGIVTGMAAGTVTITVQSRWDDSIQATVTLTIKAEPPETSDPIDNPPDDGGCGGCGGIGAAGNAVAGLTVLAAWGLTAIFRRREH